MGFDTKRTIEAIRCIIAVIEENKQYLTDLDAAIGDGDHGINLSRGFGAVSVKLDGVAADVLPSDVLKAVAMELISKVGGASGPLYGGMFLKMSGEVKGKAELDMSDFGKMMAVGIESIKQRGKSEQGEKTMLDVQIPVYQTLEKCAADGKTACEAMAAAAATARECTERTKDIKATKGRASYVGERSIGHIDPGAMSSCLMIETLSRYLAESGE